MKGVKFGLMLLLQLKKIILQKPNIKAKLLIFADHSALQEAQKNLLSMLRIAKAISLK
jgi:hypothetical protein